MGCFLFFRGEAGVRKKDVILTPACLGLWLNFFDNFFAGPQ